MSLRSLSALIAVCALVFASGAASSQEKRGPSTPEERAQALKYIEDFQSDPLNQDLKPEVSWVAVWVIEVPDIHITICFLTDLPKGDKRHSQTLFNAMMLAQTRFAIHHRGETPDVNDEFMAGLDGMLNAYETVLAAYPKDRQPALDDLLERRKAGTLADFVKQAAAERCKNKQ